MNIDVGEVIPENKRRIIRKMLKIDDLKYIESKLKFNGGDYVGWRTMQKLTHSSNPSPVTERNKVCLAPMWELALKTKDFYVEKLKARACQLLDETQKINEEINSLQL